MAKDDGSPEMKGLGMESASRHPDRLPERPRRGASPVPYYHPELGWFYRGKAISEESFDRLCDEKGIPRKESSEPKRLWLANIRVAGTCYVEGIERIIGDIRFGDRLTLSRDFRNHYDKRAVAVSHHRTDARIGFVPRDENAILSNLMESGILLEASVAAVKGKDIWMDVCMEVPGQKAVRRHFDRPSEDLLLFGSSGLHDVAAISGRPAAREDFMFVDFEEYVSIPFERKFSDEELWDLRWGHIPQSVDDRWGFFFSDDVLHIYRSWTGDCMYKLKLDPGGKHELQVCNELRAHMHTGEEERERYLVGSLLDSWLSPAELPISM